MRKNQAISVSLFAFFVAFTPVTVFFSQYFGWSYNVLIGDPWLPMSGWLLIGSLLFVAYLVSSSQVRLSSSPLFVPLLILIIWAGLSGFWAHNSYLVFIKWQYWFTGLLGFIYVINVFREHKAIVILLQALFISGVLMAGLGLLQYYYNVDWVFQSGPPSGVFGNRNMAAQYSLLLLPIAYCLFLFSQQKLMKAIILVSVVVIIWFISIVNSMAVYLSLAVILLAWSGQSLIQFIPITYPRHTIFYMFAIVLTLLMSAVVYYLDVSTLLNTEYTQEQEEFSIKLRIIKWLNAWELYKNHWLLGIGLNNWAIEYPLFHQAAGVDHGVKLYRTSDNTHNDFIQLLVELGLIGLIISALILSKIAKMTYFSLTHSNKDVVTIGIAMTLSLIAFGVISLFSFPAQLPHTIYLIIIFMAILSALGEPVGTSGDNEEDEISPRKNFLGRRFAAGALLVCSLGAVVLYFNLYMAEIWYRKAHQYYIGGDYAESKLAADIAVEYNPYRYETLKYRAIAYVAYGDIKAEEMMLEVLKLYPNSLNSLNRILHFYIQQQQFMKALTVAMKIKSIAPNSDYTYSNLILVYRALGNSKGFVINLSRLKDINPGHPLIKNMLVK
jgi:hypothetical protein